MNFTKIAIMGIILISAWFIFSDEKYDTISFSGEVFEHVETINVNNAKTVFYTPNGVALEESPKFIQLLQITNPDITETHLKGLRQHLSRTMALKPIKGYKNRYFGVLNNKDLTYALEKGNVFIIYVVIGGFSDNKNKRLSEASQVIGALDSISLSHLN